MTLPIATSTSRPVTCLTNAYLVLPDGNLTSSPASIWVDATAGKIVAVSAEGTQLGEPVSQCDVVDLDGAIVGPGLIDVQINGAFGVDFSKWENDEGAYRKGVEQVANDLLQTGVTSFVPTIIVSVGFKRADKSLKHLQPTLLFSLCLILHLHVPSRRTHRLQAHMYLAIISRAPSCRATSQGAILKRTCETHRKASNRSRMSMAP